MGITGRAAPAEGGLGLDREVVDSFCTRLIVGVPDVGNPMLSHFTESLAQAVRASAGADRTRSEPEAAT